MGKVIDLDKYKKNTWLGRLMCKVGLHKKKLFFIDQKYEDYPNYTICHGTEVYRCERCRRKWVSKWSTHT